MKSVIGSIWSIGAHWLEEINTMPKYYYHRGCGGNFISVYNKCGHISYTHLCEKFAQMYIVNIIAEVRYMEERFTLVLDSLASEN